MAVVPSSKRSKFWGLIVLALPLQAQSPSEPLQQALALFNSGKYRECYQVISPYVQQNPQSAAGHKLLGMDEYMLGNPARAIEEVRRAAELNPKDAEAYYYLGRLHFSTNNAPAALKAFQKAIELDSSSVRSWNHIGQTYEALGRPRDAEQAYLKAMELEQKQTKKSEWPYYNLGVLCLGAGRVDESASYFRQALARNPNFSEAKTKLAVAASKQRNIDEALKLLKEAVQDDPRSAEAHYRLAQLLWRSGRQEEARQHFALFEKYRTP